MTPRRVPLGVLDLVPISSGSNPREAVLRSLELARSTESFGYERYWFAEHHLNPGVAGSSPPVMIALAAGATEHIRVGSGGVQSGHRTALAIVEEFGLLDARFPGRIDLGIGRSGGRGFRTNRDAPAASSPGSAATNADGFRTPNGLLIPARPSIDRSIRSPRARRAADLLQQPEAQTPDYEDLVRAILGFLQASRGPAEGEDPHPIPGRGANLEIWILGSSAGESALVAAEEGLRFAANYHVSPATVLEAIDAYRTAFRASETLDHPYVAVSADVVVAPDDDEAAHLAAGFGPWVYSIRSGQGAIEYPTTEEASCFGWTDEARAFVADRVETQFVGSPPTVVAGLERLQEATGADELIITTVTHRHEDRTRSYELLASAWRDR